MANDNLELLTQADYVLSPCGRPVPPAGYRFIDLPRVIPFHFDNEVGGQPGTPFNRLLSNTANTLFLCKGIALNSGFQARLRWPSGRFLSAGMMFNENQVASPQGVGSTMLALTEEMPLDPDARISVQLSGLGTITGGCDLDLWGVLRYMLKVSDGSNGGRSAGNGGNGGASCLIGYPAIVKNNGAGLDLIDDPIETLKARPRYLCGPNQNIMAPEWALGNQCTPETPDGWTDEPFTFFSQAIAIPHDGEIYNIPVIVPGGGEDFIVKSLKFFTTYTDEYFSVPVLQLRLPNGFSMMGGDMIPVAYDQNFIPNVFELPVFPTLPVTTGMRIILDAADMLVSGVGTATLIVQFVGCKRRRAQ